MFLIAIATFGLLLWLQTVVGLGIVLLIGILIVIVGTLYEHAGRG